MTTLWGRLGWQDVRRRYRRTAIGPWWITISTGLTVGLLATLHGGLFRLPVEGHLPHVAAGLVVWVLLSGLVTEGCAGFVQARGIVLHINLPLSLHVYRMVWRNLLASSHNAALPPVVALGCGVWPGWTERLAGRRPGMVDIEAAPGLEGPPA